MRQIAQPRGNFIEKIIRDANGRLLRATFCVYENGGHIKARLLSAVYIEESSLGSQTPVLADLKAKETYSTTLFRNSKIVSPFSTSYLYYILGSTPRAPTF
ncbi:MAG: hypothetical protein WCK48_02570 [bacterium]